METIWQKVDKTISRLKIFQNTATIILNRITTDVLNGTTSVCKDRFEIKCRAPEKINAYVNTSLAKGGDLTIIIDYLALREIYDGNDIGLQWDSHNAILHPGTDEIEFCGVVYAIREIIAEDWKDNMPGQYIVVLKCVSAEE